jgi:16S rRNA (cytosine967-C5)-methyltransferase
MSVEISRQLALDVLLQVERGSALEPMLEKAYRRLPEARQRAFLSEIVKGALRWRARYDRLIDHFSRRRATRDPALLIILRLGLHQLLACRGVPSYATLHQAGELCRVAVSRKLVPYVNGVLQQAVRFIGASPLPAELAIRPLFPDPDVDPLGYLSDYHSHPPWLIERWLERFGFDGCEALCRHNNRPAMVVFHVLPPAHPQTVATKLEEAGVPVRPGQWHARALVALGRPGRAELTRILADQRDLIVQDEGAQCAATWLARGLSGRLLDLCAAPGGKTFHLRRLWPRAQDVIAMDLRRDRLSRLQETVKRIETEPLAVVLADGIAPPFAGGRFAAVLLDGPCSGTGVLRHHPEGRWRLRPEELARSRQRLLALGRQAGRLLAPQGRLLYVTCSLEFEENEAVIADLLAEKDLGLEPEGDPDRSSAGAGVRAWLPQETGTDGFFAARFIKRGSAA